MSEIVGASAAHSYRDKLQAKARRLGGGEDARSVDASDFTPGEPLDADAKTGMRPISRQARAAGGRIGGFCAGGRADRPARAKGGGFGESYANRNQKEANEDRAGRKHDMGLAAGGRPGRASGGINEDNAVYKPDKEREGASRTRELKRKSGSSAVETRVARQGGGPLAAPLAAGMGGQGRFNFNFPANRAQVLKDGGRAKAHERYGRQGGGGVGQPSAKHPQMKGGSRDKVEAEARERASGGEVAKKVLAAHHAEHEAMKKGRAAGGSISDDPPSYARAQARQDRAASIAQKAAFRAAGKSKAGGGPVITLKGTAPPPKKPTFTAAQAAARDKLNRRKGGRSGHPEGCACPRCVASKAKGGLLSKWTADQKAAGGRVGRAKGGKAGTKINIIIAPGGANPPDPNQAGGGLPPNLALKPPPAAPMPMPGGPPGAPPGAPMPMPIPIPMGGGMPGAGMAGGASPPRKRGGRVSLDVMAGSGSGIGRLQKAHAEARR